MTLSTASFPKVSFACYSQVALIFTIFVGLSVKLKLVELEGVASKAIRNVRCNIVKIELDVEMFCGTRRVDLIKHFLVLKLSTCRRNLKVSWFNYIAEKHARATFEAVYKCKACEKKFTAFLHYAKANISNVPQDLRQKLRKTMSCKMKRMMSGYMKKWKPASTFFTDFEIENRRHKVFILAMSTMHWTQNFCWKKLVFAFKSLNGVARLNVWCGCMIENIEDGSCRFYYAHEKKKHSWSNLSLWLPNEVWQKSKSY